MNKIITSHVLYRNSYIPVDQLKEQSQIKVIVECSHGQREVKWCRRNQLCKKCSIEKGVFNTSKPGRNITWGDKISKVKKGTKFSQSHKDALVLARREKLAKRLNKDLNEVEFPTKNAQYKIRLFMMGAINKSPLNKSLETQDKLFAQHLGYSVEELRERLQSLFKPGMTWDNYGDWEIDHIKPDSWFSYSSMEDQGFQDSWALSNLQPMWAEQNRKKNNLYSGNFKDKTIYLLCGQSGVGKTTVANQLHDFFTILDKDNLKKIKDLDKAVSSNWFNDKPILLQVGFHISSTIRRFQSKGYIVKSFFIIEEPSIVSERIQLRGGKRLNNVEERYKRIKSLAVQVSTMSSNAVDMVQYLLKYGQETFRNRHDSRVST